MRSRTPRRDERRHSGSIRMDGPDVVRLPLIDGSHIEAAVNGHKVRLLVDYGYSGAVRLSDPAWKQAIGAMDAGTAVQNSVAADGATRRSRVAQATLNIGRLSSQNATVASGFVPVGAGAGDGLIGTGFFLQGTSVVDGPAKQVMFIDRRKPNMPAMRRE